MVKRQLLEEICKKEINGHLVINMITKRVRQLFRGDKSMVEDPHVVDCVDIAIKEFLDGKLQVKQNKSVL
ncbi:MAG: DNA-directed RNA polymerase subunit omega [Chlamydiae bacterium]|nr:DNA-directed RNA polymerase subunit omega [Chlamydiota bacterium]MBI3267290.1 DNA-directed RNA polymerase subunit omega [Chlamydiota bacterium]